MAIWGSRKLEGLFDKCLITHADRNLIGPASIDVRLGNSFLVPKSQKRIRLGDEVKYRRYKISEGKGLYIRSGEFMLATTQEYISVPKETAVFVQGRSSIGRACLSVQNAGFVDPGFYGNLTLELKNDGPFDIWLTPGYPIAQLVYMDAEDVGSAYSGKYNGQIDATGSRMHWDKDIWTKKGGNRVCANTAKD